MITDLAAERTGNHVLLSWTTPARTTDDLPVKGAQTALICREAGPRPGSPAARLAACAPVLRLAVAPGRSEVSDTLPAPLCSGPVLLLTYRIQILNSAGRSGGDSTIAAFAASGSAPSPVDSFNVTASEHGPILEWTPPAKSTGDQVELIRTDLSAAPAAAKPARSARLHNAGRDKPGSREKPVAPSNEVRLRTSEPPAGTVDTTATFGRTYTYTAARLRPISLGQRSLEIRSEPSSLVTIVLRDTFPPHIPVGLATIAGLDEGQPAYIDLSWEPGTEPDLAGYIVYRQLARPNGDAQGPPARLTVSPVTGPAYRDVAVRPGQRYIYQVTAVDASGNESAPSAKAQEVIPSSRSPQPN